MDLNKVSDAEKQAALEARRAEVQFYRNNISICSSLISSLPSVWPEPLEKFRRHDDRHASAAKIEKLEDVELFAKLILHDDMQAKIRAETFEMTKAQAILDQMESDL